MRNFVAFLLFSLVVVFWGYGLVAYKYPGKLLAKFDVKDVIHHISPLISSKTARNSSRESCFEIETPSVALVRLVYDVGSSATTKTNHYTLAVTPPNNARFQHDFKTHKNNTGNDSVSSKIISAIPIFGGRIVRVLELKKPQKGTWCFNIVQTQSKFTEDYIFIEIRNKSLPHGGVAFACGFIPLILLFIYFPKGQKKKQ